MAMRMTADHPSSSPEMARYAGIPDEYAALNHSLLTWRRLLVHILLFVATAFTTTLAGMIWRMRTDLVFLSYGIPYACCVLFILSCHEFGHYFAARHHRVAATLPYFIPLWPIDVVTFGTFGAVIRVRSPIPDRRALFDIGIAGPIAGFVASLAVLAAGFATLPGPEFLLGIHPNFDFRIGAIAGGNPPGETLAFGSTILYRAMEFLFAKPGAFVPPMTEMYHYPMLLAGWFGLLVTAYNLMPVGSLDGGHIAYAMFGERQKTGAWAVLIGLFLLGTLGVLPIVLSFLGMQTALMALLSAFPGYSTLFWPGWLIWAIFVRLVIRVKHPPIYDETPINRERRILGWFALGMLLVCFTPAPIFFR
jgi:membrane-associated protease RseP (regulator of RpoE activity)